MTWVYWSTIAEEQNTRRYLYVGGYWLRKHAAQKTHKNYNINLYSSPVLILIPILTLKMTSDLNISP